MKCPRCQHENRSGAKFCEECATPLARTCSNCGSQLSATAKFCPECAQPVAGAAAEVRFASPESYTPKHLAEKILTSKSALEGERKQVTVLFADLKGSMELLADRDPEEARKILDPVLERMMEAVHRYEGTVNQVMGDGIMALFGAPLAHEDHAVRACYAALRMQESVKRYAEGMRRQEGITVRIRVGLNSGEVVVRAIGSDLHMDYTAVGHMTHLAARMEQLADPGTVLLTFTTLALSEDFIQVRLQGPTPVKGLSEPVDVYELVGATPVRSRFHAHAARGLTTFVGRASEMAHLGEALDLARHGHGQVAAVVGEPGVGKSRLFWELGHSHRTDGCLVLESASVSYGKATTYLPVIELLRGYFQLEPGDDTRKIREKATGKLLSLDRSLERAVSPLLSLLDVPLEDDAWARLDPTQRRQRILDALKRLVLRESQVQPLVLVFEDLHWIDGETQAVLDGLVESLPTARVLLLVNYRPEYQHGWGGKTYYRQLQVDALPPSSAENLLQTVLGTDLSLAPLKRLLIDRTEGNPLFLEESVRTLAETRVLAGEPGAYRLARALDSLQIPATAQAIIAARIDRLEPEDKRLLQAASVLGRDVPLVLLEAITDDVEDEMRQRLARLRAAEFLYEARLFPEVEYAFKHALIHEVTYGTLLQDRRKALHACIVGAIERSYPDRLSEHVERLAHHAERGELWDKAVTYLRQAGAKALTRFANREAVSCFEQALTSLRHLPETRRSQEQNIDLCFDLRTALFPLGEFERIVGYLRDAEGLAMTLDDQWRLGQQSVVMCHNLFMAGHPAEALAFGHRARGLAESLGDVRLKVTGTLYLGVAYTSTGDYGRAKDLLLKVLSLLEGDLSRDRLGLAGFPAVTARFHLTWVSADRGDFEEGIAYSQEGRRFAESLDNPYSRAPMFWIPAYLHIVRGELAQAVDLLEHGVALCREWNLTYFLVAHTGSLGYTYALSRRVQEGIPLLEHALDAGEAMGFGALQPLFVGYLAEAYMLADRLADAGEFSERALTLARERGQRPYEAWALRLLGEIVSHHSPPDVTTVEAHFAAALAVASELGMRPLVAHCHLGLGKLSRRTGQREQAQEHLATATTMYREMGMTYWLEQAEKEGA
jgi:class 3 adenylate cyclase/tetratricopeptide (TPR) repeat protein